jgi:formylglycine-generating enzyme required for sulfatase activity
MRSFLLLAAIALAPSAGTRPAVVNDGFGDCVLIPAGSFRMGDNFNEGNARERPVHVVELDAYYIGKYKVTNAEWSKFRDDAGYNDPKIWPDGKVFPQADYPFWNDLKVHGGGVPENASFPVLGVNWDEATAYCAWLSAKTGKRYRLPTEAEWEKAARGTDQRRYPWGNTVDPSYANYYQNPTPYSGSTSPVGFYDGSKRGEFQTHSNASPYGAFDMVGSTFEWCSDWYATNYYSFSPRKAPKGPAEGAYRVLRGACYYMEVPDLRATNRSSFYAQGKGHDFIGFRVVREP